MSTLILALSLLGPTMDLTSEGLDLPQHEDVCAPQDGIEASGRLPPGWRYFGCSAEDCAEVNCLQWSNHLDMCLTVDQSGYDWCVFYCEGIQA